MNTKIFTRLLYGLIFAAMCTPLKAQDCVVFLVLRCSEVRFPACPRRPPRCWILSRLVRSVRWWRGNLYECLACGQAGYGANVIRTSSTSMVFSLDISLDSSESEYIVAAPSRTRLPPYL